MVELRQIHGRRPPIRDARRFMLMIEWKTPAEYAEGEQQVMECAQLQFADRMRVYYCVNTEAVVHNDEKGVHMTVFVFWV